MNVYMFHSIGCDEEAWHTQWLSCDRSQFYNLCAFLHARGLLSIHLDEWYHLVDHPEEQTGKEVLLTFDDGYLDNWVVAHDILERFGLKATLFVNPEFVQKEDQVRPRLGAESQPVEQGNLQRLGFLNWSELKAMQASEVWDVQSHSMTHDFVFRSDHLVDLFTGQTGYYWLTWPRMRDQKPYYLEKDLLSQLPRGLPVFSYGRALGERQFFPHASFEAYCQDEFTAGREVEAIVEEANTLAAEEKGRWETDFERKKRYQFELTESKRILESKLGKPVDFLCWPGGGYTPESVALSLEAGYKASTLASRDGFLFDKHLHGAYKRIRRKGMGSFVATRKGYRKIKDRNYLVTVWQGKGGSFVARVKSKFYKTLAQVQ